MRLLKREGDVLEELLPGLDSALAAMSLRELELPENPGLKAFTPHGGPGLLGADRTCRHRRRPRGSSAGTACARGSVSVAGSGYHDASLLCCHLG